MSHNVERVIINSACWYGCLQVERCRLVSTMLLVFVRSGIYNAVRDIATQSLGTGMLGTLVRMRIE